ncbi:hypothetical protein D0U04_23470 [Bacillus clarus]|uniref:Uncharacterized protein n=1 Tax=Bacillus clarus TaxID=2338372 RepID=A0A090YU69_9BACI|nr:hypothetical protein [Bacillus clarus]KFN01802.1 hypothetical protein DJ93_4992 [Bacillus clarus]RFT63933.1 hypothetical protein D0U04_23470 [Bacillus clarus]
MASHFSRFGKKCSGHHDDCWDKFEECKREHNERCDCCCVQGIRDELKKLVNHTVRIDTEGHSYAGIVTSVSCDVVKLAAIPGSHPAIVSLCKIEAIVLATTTVTAKLDLDGIDLANKA